VRGQKFKRAFYFLKSHKNVPDKDEKVQTKHTQTTNNCRNKSRNDKISPRRHNLLKLNPKSPAKASSKILNEKNNIHTQKNVAFFSFSRYTTQQQQRELTLKKCKTTNSYCKQTTRDGIFAATISVIKITMYSI
jgi:hypothetical protein